MIARRPLALAALLLAALIGAAPMTSICGAQAKQKAALPAAVLASLNEKFPGNAIDKRTKETEKGVVVYDIEFTQNGRKAEADISADGAIQNFERQFDAEGLPKAVLEAVQVAHPGATIVEVMETTEVLGTTEVPAGFEITLTTRARKRVELTLSRDGKPVS